MFHRGQLCSSEALLIETRGRGGAAAGRRGEMRRRRNFQPFPSPPRNERSISGEGDGLRLLGIRREGRRTTPPLSSTAVPSPRRHLPSSANEALTGERESRDVAGKGREGNRHKARAQRRRRRRSRKSRRRGRVAATGAKPHQLPGARSPSGRDVEHSCVSRRRKKTFGAKA